MLFNKDGELVEPEAKRPSDETLYDDLMKLIAEPGPVLSKDKNGKKADKPAKEKIKKKKKDKKKRKKKGEE